ncbi:DUF4148 domain-containing protein [Paraburkholderia sacchari]|nr:DUF4148 domain-containing protein [Paraburkholderia sacchari]
MKLLFNATVLAAATVVPLAAFAQTVQPLPRAEVRTELTRAEQAGYTQDDRAHYLEHSAGNSETAQAHIAARDGDTAYGASTGGSSQTGQRTEITVSPYSPPIEVIGH